MNWADHVLEAHEDRSPNETKDDGAKERADETLDSLLRRELEQRSSAESDTPDVCEAVVTNDK